jgi:hypothetical protein
MWFTENPWPPMLLAGVGALLFFGLWNNNRRKLYGLCAVACLVMTGVIYAVERVIVTDGEKLQAQVALLCDQFRRRDPATLEQFSATAPDLKLMCASTMQLVEVGNDLRLTDMHTTFSNANSRANVHFRANATISVMGFNGHHPFRCVLGFQKEGGTWKIVDIERLHPIKGDKIGLMDKG